MASLQSETETEKRDGIERRIQLRRDNERGQERRVEERRQTRNENRESGYALVREPTEREWTIRSAWLHDHSRSVSKTAFAFGIERIEVLGAIRAVKDWLVDSGWAAEFRLAKQTGFSDADARLRADIVADFNQRKARGE